MTVRFTPRLARTHPNFFLIFFVIAVVFHLGIGMSQLLTPERYLNPSLVEVYRFAPVQAWGATSVLCWALMTVGAYRRFDIFARLGIAIGFFLCLSRGLLIELGPGGVGGGLFVWIPMAAQHWVQMAEPQANPLTAKE